MYEVNGTLNHSDCTSFIPIDSEGNSFTGGSGSMENGILSYSIGTPAPADLQSIETLFATFVSYTSLTYANIHYNTSGVKAAQFDRLYSEQESFSLSRQRSSATSYSYEGISYIYVDNDVTVTADGTTTTQGGGTIKTNNLNLQLKAGWNAIYFKASVTMTSSTTGTGIQSLTVGDLPSINWVVENDG